MRNPDRIEPIIEKLHEIWKLVPDLRFGQLVSNFLGYAALKTDPFYVEDYEMEELLDEYRELIEEKRRKRNENPEAISRPL